MTDGLSNLQFKESNSESNFIKFVAGTPVKLRVFTTNPTIHINRYGKEQISFAVWNWDEDKAMILSKGPSIARQISHLHNDEDFGADITKLDIKIMPTGEDMNREYSVNVLPKAQDISEEQIEALKELDESFSKIFKGSVRAEEYNNGVKPENFIIEEGEPVDSDTKSEIPF
jgi:hypothetical protein